MRKDDEIIVERWEQTYERFSVEKKIQDDWATNPPVWTQRCDSSGGGNDSSCVLTEFRQYNQMFSTSLRPHRSILEVEIKWHSRPKIL